MYAREHIERIVKETFVLYGGAQLDTPVFERKEILAGKYGEDAKLIFDLKDQGGEELALRYDQHRGAQRGQHEHYAKPYFYAALCAYITGLGVTMTVMHVFKAAQPALLYLRFAPYV